LDKIDKYLIGQAGQDAADLLCKREIQFIEIQRLLELAETMNAYETRKYFFKKEIEGIVDLKDLRNQLNLYREIQDGYLLKLKNLDLSSLDKKEVVVTDFLPGGQAISHRDLLNTDYEKLIVSKKNFLTTTLEPKERLRQEKLIVFFQKAMAIKQGVMTKYPQYAERAKIIEELKADESLSQEMALGISKEAQKAYEAYYEALSKKKSDKFNPCKDFVL
jgi:hypothetical protein